MEDCQACISDRKEIPRSFFLWSFGLLIIAYPLVCIGMPSIANRVAGILALLALFWGWSGMRSLTPELKVLFWAVLLYIGMAVLSLWNNSNWDFAGWRFSKYYPFLVLPFLAGICVRAGNWLRPLLFGSLCAASLWAALLSGYQLWVLHLGRAGWGSVLHPNIFGHLAALFGVILFGFAYVQKFRGTGLISLLFCTLALFAALASGSRGVMLGVIPALMIIPVVDFFALGLSATRLKLGAGVFFALALLCLLAMGQSELWRTQWRNLGAEIQAYSSGDYTFTSVGSRLAMYHGGYLVWQNHPWIGTGLGDVQDDINGMILDGRVPLLEETLAILHNMYMDCLASTGLLGTTAMIMAVFIVPGWYFYRRLRHSDNPDARAACLAGIGAIVLNAIFGATNSWLYLRGLLPVLILFTELAVLAQQSLSDSRRFEEIQ